MVKAEDSKILKIIKDTPRLYYVVAVLVFIIFWVGLRNTKKVSVSPDYIAEQLSSKTVDEDDFVIPSEISPAVIAKKLAKEDSLETFELGGMLVADYIAQELGRQ